MSENTAVGQPLSRIDGRAKVTGQAKYAAEAPIQNASHAVIVPSTIAKGRVKSIDATKALAAPGVLAVVTPENIIKFKQGQGMITEKRTALADMEIHYAGQHIAVVVADTPERARFGASLLDISYVPETPVVDLHDPRAKEVVPPKNQGQDLQLKRGDVDAALAQSGLTVVKATYTTPVETHNPMEMSATTAIWEDSTRLTAWNATQAVSGNQGWLAASFDLKQPDVRVLCPFTGGGFGCKGGNWPHIALAGAVAKAAGRPIRQVLTRQQMFTSCGHRPATEQTMTLAAGADGKLVALRHDTLMNGSALSDFIESCAVGTSQIMYAAPNFQQSHVIHQVDIAPPTFMRAPGEASGSFALESGLDELAIALGMDPVELRFRNHADVNPQTGKPWSSKHLKECYQMGMEKFGWSRRNAKPGTMRSPDGRRMGWGMATAGYPAHKFPGTARIRLYADGDNVRAVGAAASQDLGTGTWTIGTQMTATLTGLPMDRVKFEMGDSNLPTSGVSGGSTTAASVGQALSEATEALKGELLKLAGSTLNSAEVVLEGGHLKAKTGDTPPIKVADLIRKSGKPYVEGGSAQKQGQPGNSDENARKYEFHSFGAHFVEVFIDEPCPRVIVNRVVSVIDVGKVLNPKTAHSQVIGGAVMGIGMALMEETHYDPRTGRPMNDNLADYAVCVNPDIHTLEAYFVEYPDTIFTPLGSRGVGEIGITGIAAAVANAVYHATGKRIRDLPITVDKML